MKKILFILAAIMIIGSCTIKENKRTFIVKFKDGTEMKVIGIRARAVKNGFYVYHKGAQKSVFSKDDVLYILKE